MLKEELGICPYEENYNEKEIIIINIEESFNELLDESEEELIKDLNKELNKELDKKSDKESDKESNKKTSDEELIEIINPKKDEDSTDWYDKNKFKKILTTIDRIKFNHKNKVGKLKFNDINNLVNSINNYAIDDYYIIKQLNNYFKTINETKSFKEQIEILKTIYFLDEY